MSIGLAGFRPPPGGRRGQSGQAPLVRFRVRASLRRSPVAPCGPGNASMARTIPLRRCAGRCAPTRWPARPCGFFDAFTPPPFTRGRRPCGSFVAGVLRGSRTGPAQRTVLATWPHASAFAPCAATSVGFASRPSQFSSRHAGERASSAHRARTHLPFRRRPPREDFSREPPDISGRTHGTRPRLLGFGPAVGPCRSTGRPRYSFCAEGRSGFPAETAMGFQSSLGSSPPVRGRHFWRDIPPVGFSRFARDRSAVRSLEASRLPFGAWRGRRLVAPASRARAPSGSRSPYEVFAPAAGRPPDSRRARTLGGPF